MQSRLCVCVRARVCERDKGKRELCTVCVLCLVQPLVLLLNRRVLVYYDVSWKLFLQCVPGGAMACSAETLAAVWTGLCVTPVMGPASAASAGLDPAVRQVLQIFHNKKNPKLSRIWLWSFQIKSQQQTLYCSSFPIISYMMDFSLHLWRRHFPQF